MEKHQSSFQLWSDSLKDWGSDTEKPVTPIHVIKNHPLTPLFTPMKVKLAVLNEEYGLAGMSTFKPLILHLNGDMPEDDYSSCSKLMGAFLNIITDAIIQQTNASQTPVTSTINNIELWVEAFRHFPFPVITGPKEVHHSYSNSNFTLDEDKDFIEYMVGIKGVEGLADAVIEAAKEAGQQLKQLSKQEKDFKYSGIIFGYFQQHICIRLVKFIMHMKETDTTALCEGKTPTSLNCEYYNHHFFGDTRLILQVATEIQAAETVLMENFVEVTLGKQARLLMTFLKHNFPLLLAHWLDKLTAFIKSKDNQIPTSLGEVKQESSTRPQSVSSVDQKSEPNLDEVNCKEREQELLTKDQADATPKNFESMTNKTAFQSRNPTFILEEPNLLVISDANLVKPNTKQYALCLTIVEEFWNQQSNDGKTIQLSYMDGTCTEKKATEESITCQLDRQHSFTDKTGKTFVNYQLKCESNSFACVLIQIPGKEQGGIFAYDLLRVKNAFNDSLNKQEVVKLSVDPDM